MIFAFGIHKDKANLAGMKVKLESMLKVKYSGNKIPFWYLEDIDDLQYKIAELECKIQMAEEK